MKKVNKKWIEQCRKYMFSFFDYLPTKYEANPREWKIRKFIWGFKDGKFTHEAAEIVARKLREVFGQDTQNIVFACIPASSAQKNEIRYRSFSDEVCRLAGTANAYHAIGIEGSRLAIHETKSSKTVSNVEIINFDKEFFKGKKVVVFDDIITQGYSYARFACMLESFGAQVLGGLFLGRTLLR